MYGDIQKRFVLPDAVITHFHLRDEDLVADFGAGTGYFLPTLSKKVGRDGKVYACEIQQNLIETIMRQKTERKLANVVPLRCDLEHQIPLKEAELDAGVMVNALFQFEDKVAVLTEVARVMRPGAKLFIIDWSESFNGMGPQSADVVSMDEARTLAEGVGFRFERDFPAGEHHYGLALRREK